MSNLKFAPVLVAFVLAGCAATPAVDQASEEGEQALTSFVCADDAEGAAVDGEEQAIGIVKAARAGGHPGFDRFVLEFTGGNVPQWEVHRTPTATFGMDGSGAP